MNTTQTIEKPTQQERNEEITDLELPLVFSPEKFPNISDATRNALSFYWEGLNLSDSERQQRIDQLIRRYELMKIFARADEDKRLNLSTHAYDAMFLGGIIDNLYDKDPWQAQIASQAMFRFLKDYDTSVDKEELGTPPRKEFLFGLLAERAKLPRFHSSQIDQIHSRPTDDPAERQVQADLRRSLLQQDSQPVIDKQLWCESPRGLKPSVINEQLMQDVQPAAMVIAAIETLDILSEYNSQEHIEPPTSNILRQSHLAETILSPLMHTFRFKSLSMTLRSEGIMARFANGGLTDLRDQAKEMIAAHGDHTVYAKSADNLRRKIFDESEQELSVRYDRNHHTWTCYGIADVELRSGKKTRVEYSIRRKTLGSLEDKLARQRIKGETGEPADMMGIEIKVDNADDIPEIAGRFLEIIMSDTDFQLNLSPSRKKDPDTPIEKAIILKGNLVDATKTKFDELEIGNLYAAIDTSKVAAERGSPFGEVKFTVQLSNSFVDNGQIKTDQMPWEIAIKSEDVHQEMELGPLSHVWAFKLGQELDDEDLVAVLKMHRRAEEELPYSQLYASYGIAPEDLADIARATEDSSSQESIKELIDAARMVTLHDTTYAALALEEVILSRSADSRHHQSLIARAASALSIRSNSDEFIRDELAAQLRIWKEKTFGKGVNPTMTLGHFVRFINDLSAEKNKNT